MKTYYARIPGTQLFIRVPRWLYNRWPWCGVVQMPNAKLMDAAPEPSHSTGVTD